MLQTSSYLQCVFCGLWSIFYNFFMQCAVKWLLSNAIAGISNLNIYYKNFIAQFYFKENIDRITGRILFSNIPIYTEWCYLKKSWDVVWMKYINTNNIYHPTCISENYISACIVRDNLHFLHIRTKQVVYIYKHCSW